MSIYLNKYFGVKNTYQLKIEKKSYLNHFYENYTNFINIKPTKYETVNESLKIALVAATVGIFIILSLAATLLDTINETVDLTLKAYYSFSKPVDNLEFIKEFLKENKEYFISVVALTSLTALCIINQSKITAFIRHVKKFFIKENKHSSAYNLLIHFIFSFATSFLFHKLQPIQTYQFRRA